MIRQFELKLMIRPIFPKITEIILTGDLPDNVSMDILAKLAFDVEYTLNEHLPQIRVHANIREKENDVQN